jgi:hypothetical protein
MVDKAMLSKRLAKKSRQLRRGIFLIDRVVSSYEEHALGSERWNSPRPGAWRPYRTGREEKG